MVVNEKLFLIKQEAKSAAKSSKNRSCEQTHHLY